MQQQNQHLKLKLECYERELEIVKWYISVMEDGIDTKNVIEEYSALK